MKPIPFHTPYPRPERFSDPFGDFDGEDGRQALAGFLAKPDDEFGFLEFTCILGQFLPAGTYEESVYFLPFALRFIGAGEDQDGVTDVLENVLGWIEANADSLGRDGLLEPAKQSLRACFANLTSEFHTAPHEQEWWRDGKMVRRTVHRVQGGEIVATMIQQLSKRSLFAGMAEELMDTLGRQDDDPVRSTWFLEYVRSLAESFGKIRSEHIRSLVSDWDLIESHACRVMDAPALMASEPEYWRELLDTLGLSGPKPH